MPQSLKPTCLGEVFEIALFPPRGFPHPLVRGMAVSEIWATFSIMKRDIFVLSIVVTIKSCSHMACWAGSGNSEKLLSSHSLSGARWRSCAGSGGGRVGLGSKPERRAPPEESSVQACLTLPLLRWPWVSSTGELGCLCKAQLRVCGPYRRRAGAKCLLPDPSSIPYYCIISAKVIVTPTRLRNLIVPQVYHED